MSQKLDNILLTYSYDARQKNQLRLADEKGLDIDIIKDPKYDWQQMREIALAMEFGLDPAPLCNPNISSEAMENIRIHLFENQGVYENARAEVSLKRAKITSIIVFMTFFILATLAIIYANKDYLLALYEDIHLKLTVDQVQLSYGEEFHPSDFVKYYDKKNQLILPEIQKMNRLTDYEYIYEVSNGIKSVKKTLIVKVVDDKPPVITLKQSNVVLVQGSSFDAMDYLSDVNDNYDKLTKKEVNVDSDVDMTKGGKFTVLYSLSDSSGNKTTETLVVEVKRKPLPQSDTTNKNQSKLPNEGINENIKAIPDSKIFYIRDYNYDIESCKKEAISYMNKSLKSSGATYGELQPYQENGVTVGYKVFFR